MKVLVVLVLLALQAEPKVEKVDARILASDRCHYIIQGAKVSQLNTLYQTNRPGCLQWQSFAKQADHLAALKLYREEVEKAWPVKPAWLVQDLKIIDAEIPADGPHR